MQSSPNSVCSAHANSADLVEVSSIGSGRVLWGERYPYSYEIDSGSHSELGLSWEIKLNLASIFKLEQALIVLDLQVYRKATYTSSRTNPP